MKSYPSKWQIEREKEKAAIKKGNTEVANCDQCGKPVKAWQYIFSKTCPACLRDQKNRGIFTL